MMFADEADRGRLPAFLALALGELQADLAARLDGSEIALDHAVAMEVDLAFRGLNEAEAALVVGHAHGAVPRHLVRLHLAAALAHAVFELAHRSIEGVADADLDVLVRVVARSGMRHRQLPAGRVDLDPDPEQVALAVLAILLLHDHAAAGDPLGEALERGCLGAATGPSGESGSRAVSA